LPAADDIIEPHGGPGVLPAWGGFSMKNIHRWLLLWALLAALPFLGFAPRAFGKSPGPNVLLITIDTLRPDRLGCYGSSNVPTPHIDGLARKGALFTRAFAHTPMTLPSHTSILLGVTPVRHGVHDNAGFVVSDTALTLAAFLKNFGYATGAFVGAYPLDRRFGLGRGFDLYDDAYGSQDFARPTYVERKAGVVVDRAVRWLREQKSPWFCWVHCFDPHAPYEPPEPFRSRFVGRLYDGEVAFVDGALAPLLDLAGDQACVILTADHGESLGEHGEKTHGYLAYNSTLHVPLIISGRGIPAVRNDSFVSHIDIFPTICELLGLDRPAGLQGRSLRPAVQGRNLGAETIFFESLYPYYSRGWAPIRGFIRDGLKFIDSPVPELYDLRRDFQEARNLATGERLDADRKELARLTGVPADEGNGAARANRTDREALKKLRSLGYVSSGGNLSKKDFGPADDVKTLLPFTNRAEDASELYEKGRTRDAVEALKKILEERNDIDLAYTNLGAIYKREGRLQDAIAVLELGRRKLPANYEIFIAYINNLLASGSYRTVIQEITGNALPLMGSDPEIWNCLGVAYAGTRDLQDSRKAYEKSLSLDPDFPSVWTNLGTLDYLMYRESRDRADYRKAVDSYKKALALDEDCAPAYNGLGAVFRQAGQRDDAIAAWEQAIRRKPDYGEALYNLGVAYLEKGEKARALETLTKYKNHNYSSLGPAEKKDFDELILKCR